jgi:hypothetical protein
MEEFLKAAGSHMNGFPKAAEVDKFPHLFAVAFRNPSMWLLVAFGDTFMTAPSSVFLKPFKPKGFELENTSGFQGKPVNIWF